MSPIHGREACSGGLGADGGGGCREQAPIPRNVSGRNPGQDKRNGGERRARPRFLEVSSRLRRVTALAWVCVSRGMHAPNSQGASMTTCRRAPSLLTNGSETAEQLQAQSPNRASGWLTFVHYQPARIGPVDCRGLPPVYTATLEVSWGHAPAAAPHPLQVLSVSSTGGQLGQRSRCLLLLQGCSAEVEPARRGAVGAGGGRKE